jgi:hypothetical protein
MNYFHRDEEGNVIYHELKNDKELKNFFTNHFNVLHIDYNKHKQCVFDIINNFYKDGNYSAIYVQEKQQLNTRKTPLYLETSKVLDKFFNDNIVYSQFLDGMIFTNNGNDNLNSNFLNEINVEIPIINIKNGKIKSVGVKPCHGACASGAYMLLHDPGLFTKIIPAIVIPRKISSASILCLGFFTASDIFYLRFSFCTIIY